jgi:RNA polymerase primary sigma factor
MLNDLPLSIKKPNGLTAVTNGLERPSAVASREEPDKHASIPPLDRGSYSADSALQLYLEEIGKVKLLTIEEEITLSERIRNGDDEARDQMIRANLRLVVKISREYEHLGLPLLDLINEGNIGLMKAVERFDPRKGGKLSTYASWWIKQRIKRALANQSKTIRLPVHIIAKLSQMHRAALHLQDVLGREPTDQELADEMGISPSRISKMRVAAIRPASLDAPVGDEDSNEFSEIVADENAESPSEHLEEKTLISMVLGLLKNLSTREMSILNQRFGLDGEPIKTLDEVAAGFGVTRERIRQIQNIALNKLRKMLQRNEFSTT